MPLTLDRIEALAPDQPSLAAARRLLKPASWPTLAEGEGLIWGECQGSGATPYRVVVNEADARVQMHLSQPKVSLQTHLGTHVDASGSHYHLCRGACSGMGQGLAFAPARTYGRDE